MINQKFINASYLTFYIAASWHEMDINKSNSSNFLSLIWYLKSINHRFFDDEKLIASFNFKMPPNEVRENREINHYEPCPCLQFFLMGWAMATKSITWNINKIPFVMMFARWGSKTFAEGCLKNINSEFLIWWPLNFSEPKSKSKTSSFSENIKVLKRSYTTIRHIIKLFRKKGRMEINSRKLNLK